MRIIIIIITDHLLTGLHSIPKGVLRAGLGHLVNIIILNVRVNIMYKHFIKHRRRRRR